MNKAEFVSHVTADTSTSRAAAERPVGSVFSVTADARARDETLAIAGFGKFADSRRAARQGRNPRTSEPDAVPVSNVPSFQSANALRDPVSEYRYEAAVTSSPSDPQHTRCSVRRGLSLRSPFTLRSPALLSKPNLSCLSYGHRSPKAKARGGSTHRMHHLLPRVCSQLHNAFATKRPI